MSVRPYSLADAEPLHCDPEVLERYRGPLRAIAYARVRDWEAAEDLAQEALLRALRGMPKLADPSDVSFYLRRILRNLCVDFSRASHPTVPLWLVGESDDGTGPSGAAVSQLIAQAAEEEFLAQDACQRILDAIDELPERLLEVLVMRCLEGLTYAEIGRFLGVTPHTINWRLHKARRLLAEELEMPIEEPAGLPLSCRQCRRLFSPFIDGELEFPQVRRVHEHLHECERCTEELERVCAQVREVDLALASEASPDRIHLHSSPRVWNRAWELMAERADEIAQDDEQTARAMITFGVSGLTAEQLGLLLRMAQACVEANPDSPKAFAALGRVHIHRHDYQAAQAAFERAIELAARLTDPARAQRWQAAGFEGLAWVWDHLARQAGEAGDEQAATAAAERVVEYGSKARDLDTEAEAYKQGRVVEWLAYLGREEEALREIQRYLRTMAAAGKRPVYGMIGNALDLLGRREEALEYEQRAVAAGPLNSSSLRCLGSNYQALGHHEEAAFWWARAQGLRKTAGPRTQPWLQPA